MGNTKFGMGFCLTQSQKRLPKVEKLRVESFTVLKAIHFKQATKRMCSKAVCLFYMCTLIGIIESCGERRFLCPHCVEHVCALIDHSHSLYWLQ